MISLLAITVLIFVQLLAGCSGLTVRSDYDVDTEFSKYKTFAWLAATGQSPMNPAGVQTLVDKRIRNAIERELAVKGYQKLESGRPDFYLIYYAGVEEKVNISTVDYGPGTRYRQGTDVLVTSYDEGTLVLDIVDPEKNQMVWRGWAIGFVDPQAKIDEKEKLINEAVHRILLEFPPKPTSPGS